MKKKKIIIAGGITRESLYPMVNPRASGKVRAGQRELSSEALRRMNDKYMWQKLEMLLAANFSPGDLVVVFTYRPGEEPRQRKKVEADLKRFRQRLAKARRKKGKGLVMFWSIEHKHGDGRYHVHSVINATGNDYKDLLVSWRRGEIEVSKLQVSRDMNYETIARYMTKESRDDGRDKLGLRAFSYTRNARKPTVEVYRVDDDTTLQAPHGALVFNSENFRNSYGNFQYIKYFLDGSHAPRTKRRRK